MALDTSFSLEVIIAIVAILGAVWRLDGRIADLRKELKSDNVELRRELKGDIQRLETRIDRLETRIDRLEIKIDDVDRRLGEKIDEGNQRLARLEGRFEGREERLTAGGEAESPA